MALTPNRSATKDEHGAAENFIHTDLLGEFIDLDFPGKFMAPFFAVHAKYAQDYDGAWVWEYGRAAEEAAGAAWDMLAKWQALRAVKVDRVAFAERVPVAVQNLSRELADAEVRCLHDVARLDVDKRRHVLREIQTAVMAVSALKPTKVNEPMFGSKVLHHYFPSIVPVFDTAMVRNGTLRLPAYRAFLSDRAGPWLAFTSSADAGGAAALEFHRYTCFCMAQIHGSTTDALGAARANLAAAIRDFVPMGTWNDQGSFIHTLDAKVAEFCLLGAAKRLGLIGRK